MDSGLTTSLPVRVSLNKPRLVRQLFCCLKTLMMLLDKASETPMPAVIRIRRNWLIYKVIALLLQ